MHFDVRDILLVHEQAEKPGRHAEHGLARDITDSDCSGRQYAYESRSIASYLLAGRAPSM
jgi:hypothetical protein